MPGAPPIQDTIALDGDGSCIAQARHRAVDFLTRVQAEHGLPVSARAMDLTQLGRVSGCDQSARFGLTAGSGPVDLLA
jgi:hypothetical protein